MNTFKKNQIIITALAIMIAIAGYLNFTNKADIGEDQYVFNNENENIAVTNLEASGLVPNDDSLLNVDVIQELPDGAMTADPAANLLVLEDVDLEAADLVIEDADLVAEDEATTGTAQIEDPSKEAGEAVFTSSTAVQSGYFLKAKIDREQTRAYSVDILLEVINNENLAEEQKVGAAAEMIALQDRIEKEAAAESLLEAKGYKDVFVRMDDSTVDVVVNATTLSASELAQISDVVSRKTGIDPSQIVISPLRIES